MADRSRVHWSVVTHGLSADDVQLRHDDVHSALYVELAEDMNIRIQVKPHASDDPERHARELERDRAALLRLAEVAKQAAEEIAGAQEKTDG